ncbi:ABC transporter permease [Streptacidiphilus anmyonensis]|uniref:ABC transporter permease n=1 Tax=Streptacidiphilus anmyonensis TaxID=405782 RepID=UPI0009FE0635|nr:ABC transporter permease [Streptacidiphilus anmyonensis]
MADLTGSDLTAAKAQDDVAAPPSAPRRGGAAGLVRWDTAVGALLAVLLLCSFGFVGDFGNTLNLSFLIGNTLPMAVIALPMTMLVAAGEIDLSVGSVAGLSGAVMGSLWNAGMAIETIIPLCLLLGLVCGLVNGLLVTRLGLPSLAVTIGTMAAYRGIAQIVLGANSVTDFPQQYLDFGSGRIPGTFLPYAAIPWAVLAVIAVLVLHATGVGRSLFAVGASAEAAWFAGIRVKRLRLSMFAATGVVSALTGVFWVLHYASARYDNATGLELSVIAAVLLGGVDFDGGKGTLGGAIGGVFLLGTLENTMSLVDVSAQSQTVVTGVLLVVSVLGPRAGRQLARTVARRRSAGSGSAPAATG